MKTYGTYFQNNAAAPRCWGEMELINPARKRLRGEEPKEGVEALANNKGDLAKLLIRIGD